MHINIFPFWSSFIKGEPVFGFFFYLRYRLSMFLCSATQIQVRVGSERICLPKGALTRDFSGDRWMLNAGGENFMSLRRDFVPAAVRLV